MIIENTNFESIYMVEWRNNINDKHINKLIFKNNTITSLNHFFNELRV